MHPLAKGAEQRDKFGDVGCEDDQPKPNLGELVDEVGLARPGAINQQSTDCNIANISVSVNAPAMLGSAGDGVQEADESEKFVKWESEKVGNAGASGEVLAEAEEVQVARAKMQVQLLRRTRLLREGDYKDPLRDPDFVWRMDWT